MHDSLIMASLGTATHGEPHLTLSGTLACMGNIVVEVEKLLRVVEGSGASAMVQTIEYRYHARIPSLGNILRYESPHGHRPYHHVHRYDVFSGDREGTVEDVAGDWPTLGDELGELRDWCYENYSRLEPTLPEQG